MWSVGTSGAGGRSFLERIFVLGGGVVLLKAVFEAGLEAGFVDLGDFEDAFGEDEDFDVGFEVGVFCNLEDAAGAVLGLVGSFDRGALF
jgi:hypothetical protein